MVVNQTPNIHNATIVNETTHSEQALDPCRNKSTLVCDAQKCSNKNKVTNIDNNSNDDGSDDSNNTSTTNVIPSVITLSKNGKLELMEASKQAKRNKHLQLVL